MLKNYFTIAYRNILRNKLRTLVHILGLAIGIAVCLLVFHVVSYETGFDKFHQDGERIFQVNTETIHHEESWGNSGVPFPMPYVIMDEIPGIELKTHLYTLWDMKVGESGKDKIHIIGTDAILADNQFFEMFPRNWLAGNHQSALNEVNQVVLTASSAKKYFPDLSPEEVLGKGLTYFFMDTVQTTVAGVVSDYTEKSDFIFTDFISINNILAEDKRKKYDVDLWNSVTSSSQLFVKLNPNTNADGLNPKFIALVDKYMEKEEGSSTVFSLRSLDELHFNGTFDHPGADKTVLQGLIVIGFFILILAGMNFINLEMAQSIIRSKEVGIRKTLGSARSQLIFQFLLETALIVTIAIFAGVFLNELLVRYFSDFLPEKLIIDYLSFQNLGFLVVLGILLTLVSGLLPAFILSGFQPDNALKRNLSKSTGFSLGHFIQKNLTVFQFALSIGFIISVLVVSRQINFMVNKELGFDKEQVMYIQMPFLAPQTQKEALITAVDNQSVVVNSSLGSDIIASTGLWTSTLKADKDDEKKELLVQVKNIDKDYLAVYGVSLVEGRNIQNVETEMMINSTLLAMLNYGNAEDAIGRFVDFQDKEFQIVGVIPDFHSESLREVIRPMIMVYRPQNSSTLSLRLQEGTDLIKTKATLDALSKEYFPHDQAEFKFFDETVANFYESDYKLQKILGMASLMAVIISLLGLFALTSFTIAQKTKEISIRKVLGATVSQILYGISKDYILLILVSFVLAILPSWYLLSNWLKEFQFKIDMPYGLFVLAGISALFASLAIVGLHGYKVAQRNPAEVLKSE